MLLWYYNIIVVNILYIIYMTVTMTALTRIEPNNNNIIIILLSLYYSLYYISLSSVSEYTIDYFDWILDLSIQLVTRAGFQPSLSPITNQSFNRSSKLSISGSMLVFWGVCFSYLPNISSPKKWRFLATDESQYSSIFSNSQGVTRFLGKAPKKRDGNSERLRLLWTL